MKKSFFLLALSVLLIAATSLRAQETTVGGYGELHFNDPEGSTPGKLDFHRFVLYFSHTFNDWISFQSELEIEHVYLANGKGPGEIGLEQAYIDLQPWENYGFRAGIVLIPVGIINPVHEPPTFHGVERPAFHSIIIPTTWREAGLGFYGKPSDIVNFQLYYTSSFDAAGVDNVASGFSLSGLRGGRTAAANPMTSDMALSGRVDVYAATGLILGASAFSGTTTRGNTEAGDGRVTILAGHAMYAVGNFEFRAEGAMISVGDTEKMRDVLGKTVAEQMTGFYGEAAYNFLPHFDSQSSQKLFIFARQELLNTEASVPGVDLTGAYNRTHTTVGLTYKPAYNVAVKMDYQTFSTAVEDSKSTGQFNAGVGYAF